MEQFKRHWSAQPLSFLLSGLMLLPVLILLLAGASPARAQGLTTSRLPTWAVLDFTNHSGYGSGEIGRTASDAFVVELGKVNKYEIIPRQDVQTGLTTLGVSEPLNLESVQRLGHSLNADAVVVGEVASVSFSNNPRQAKVGLVIKVIDTRSGELINGALAEGKSNPRPIPTNDDDTLVNEAFANAAFAAVNRQILRFNLPFATIINNPDQNTVTLNQGARAGLYNGLNMLVVRGGQVAGTTVSGGTVVGKIRIGNVTSNDADATVTDRGQGIRPEDKATPLYSLPAYTIGGGGIHTASSNSIVSDGPDHPTHHSAFNGIGALLIGILAAVLLISLIRHGSSAGSSSGVALAGASVGKPAAREGRSSDLGGSTTALPIGIDIPQYVPVTVQIVADPGNINYQNFLEYHVYRSDFPAVLNSPINFNGTGTSTGGTSTTTGNNNNNGGSLGLAGFGQIPLISVQSHNRLVAYNDAVGVLGIEASKPDPSNNANLLTFQGFATAVVPTGTGTTTTTIQVPIPGTGLAFGQRVQYFIEGLYIQPAIYGSTGGNPGTSGNNGGISTNNNNGINNNGNNNNGNNNGTVGHGKTYQLTGRTATNFVTYIEPVHPAANAVTSTGPGNVNLTVPATAGADDYILVISTDPSVNTNTKTYRPVAASFFAPPATPTQGSPVTFNNINLTTAFPGGTQFFYKIGARDSRNGSSTDQNPYIFTDPLTLTVS